MAILSEGGIRVFVSTPQCVVGVDLVAIMLLEGPKDLVEQAVDRDHGLIGEIIREGDFESAWLPGE
jgi:hypothetical protein